MQDLPRCQGIKADGQRCERVVGKSATHCYSHDASRASERKANAAKAARSKGAPEIVSIKVRLRELAEDVVADRITTAKGAVASQIYGVLLRALELERRQREQDELRAEIDELRDALDSKGGAWGT